MTTTAEEEANNELEDFENLMNDPENSRVSRYQNTYFMDGGNRFISVSLLKQAHIFFLTLTIITLCCSYLPSVTQVQKQQVIFLESLKTGFKTNSTIKPIKTVNFLNVYPF